MVKGTANGTPLHASVCIVFHISDGHISRIYEYLDPAAASAVFGKPDTALNPLVE